ncbi:MAG TPA: MoaD/ThiS family protein [Chloroflexota bacterium]|nr:MoaD/ThiS family protein [Chloroflexota bacterium]
MSSVRIPPVLRAQTGGTREVEANGSTVGEVLRELATQYPSMESQLFADGGLQPYINVYVNNQDIQYLNKLDTPVGPSDTIILLPAMAGGA